MAGAVVRELDDPAESALPWAFKTR